MLWPSGSLWPVFGTQQHPVLILKDARALLWRGNTSPHIYVVFILKQFLEGKFTQRSSSATFATMFPNPMKDPCLQLKF